MRSLARLALLGSILTLPLAARAVGEIAPGSSAPPLAVKAWYKGAPVTGFAPGKTYVVEFWATWCGPCKDSIPHLTDLAKKNPEVTFVGVSVWEDDKDGNVKAFVDGMGDKMDYHVGYSGNQDGMAATWMKAAGQNGIPTAFVVKDGTIEWVGHPMELEKPLGEIEAGTFDRAAFKKEFDQRAIASREQMAAFKAMHDADAAFRAGRRTEAKAALAATVAKYPTQKDSADAMRFDWLATENPVAWDRQAKAMTAGKKPADLERLGSFAFARAQAPGGAPIARKAIGYALQGSGEKDFGILWYATAVYAATKDRAAQLDATNKALALFSTSSFKDDAELKAKLLKDQAALSVKPGATERGK